MRTGVTKGHLLNTMYSDNQGASSTEYQSSEQTSQPLVAEMHDVNTFTRGFFAVQSTEVDVEKISQETSFIRSS